MIEIDYGLYVVTLFGAASMYVFSLKKGFEGSISFLIKMFPERTNVFYDRLDFLVVTIMGSILGYLLLDPKQVHQALVAGLGWVSAVNVAMNNIDKEAK